MDWKIQMLYQINNSPIGIIFLTLLELFLLIIPLVISSRVEKKSILQEIHSIGFDHSQYNAKTFPESEHCG